MVENYDQPLEDWKKGGACRASAAKGAIQKNNQPFLTTPSPMDDGSKGYSSEGHG